MKRVSNKFFKIACAMVLCAGIAMLVSTCGEEEECKKCENKQEGVQSATFCGDELKEALRSDSDWKNCK
jgi:uncharacterized lipoprotein YehR (DUF1307 family)